MTPFEDLLNQLGEKLGGIPLRPDNKQCCKIEIGTQFYVQLDLTTRADRILLGSTLGTLAQGRYRDQVFLKALYVNTAATTPKGVLAFSKKTDSLILFQFLNIADLNVDKLFAAFTTFSEHAFAWKEALSRGELPEIESREN